jgi:citrate lyase subunit beta/citryl-CoA lyase
MRSKLFVPGSRPELFEKALLSQADALSFDLEDAVAADRKAEARTAVAAFLRTGRMGGKVAVVRVNALDSGLFEDDVAGLAGPGLDVINVPKVQSAADIHAAVAVIARAEQAAGVTRPIGVLANIETPRSLRLAFEIAAADPRVVGLQIGFGDLLLPYSIARTDAAALQFVRVAVRFAAAEAGVAAYDGAFFDVAGTDACRAEAEAARSLGFTGKSCIHPSQVPIVNAVFLPDRAAVDHAVRVLTAARDAAARGVGAFVVDGQLIDGPILQAARDVAASAERAGMIGVGGGV